MSKTAACNPWHMKQITILAHEYHPDKSQLDGGGAKGDKPIEELVRWKRSLNVDAEHLQLNHSMMQGADGGDDPKCYLFKNRYGFKEDWLARYLPVANKHNLKVIVYFNCHWFKPGRFPAGFYNLDGAGKPGILYGNGHGACPRGPFREWSERMAEDLGKYPIAGVFLDGPFQGECHCDSCRREFKKRYGADLPSSAAKCKPELLDAFTAFPGEAAAGYVRAFARGLRRHNPGALLYMNDTAFGSDGSAMAATAGDTNLIGAEGGFIGYGPLDGNFPFRPGSAAKVLECRAKGRARVVFSDCGFKMYDYSCHPRGEIARMYAGTIGNGANPWFLVLRNAMKTEGIRMALRFNKLIRDERKILSGTGSLAAAALVHSPLNMRLGNRPEREKGDDVGARGGSAKVTAVRRHYGELAGFYAALTRSGYPFDIIEEANILESIDERYRVVVLPGVGAIRDDVAGKLREYVRRGGNLIATFDSTLFDEEGEMRKNFALADVFGISAGGGVNGPSRLDYISAARRGPLTAGLSQEILPCPKYWRTVKAGKNAEPLLYYYEKMPRRYADLPPVSRNPAAILARYGQGRTLFIPSAIGDHYLNWRFPDERRLLANAVRMFAPPPVEIKGGDQFIETSLRRAPDGSMTLHLTNYAAGERPVYRAIPLGPLDITVKLPKGMKPRSVRGAFGAGKLAFRKTGNSISFRLLRIEEYELVAIE